MKRHLTFAIVLTISALMASDAWAQAGGGRGRGPRGGMGQAMLLQQASVQQELKLSDEQVQQLTVLAEKQRESFDGLRDLSREERQAKFAEAQQAHQEELAKVLSADQVKRLKQIAWQQRGPQALADPEVATALGLTDEQKQSVEAAQAGVREQMRELFAGGPDGDREAAREKIAALQKEAAEKLDKVLTPEQQTKYKELLGTPFTGHIERPSILGGRQRGSETQRGADASERSRFFQFARFEQDDEKAQDKGDEANQDDAKKADAKKRKGGANQKDNDKSDVKHRAQDGKHARHARHRREHGKHALHAHHRGGPNAQAWDRVAAAFGDDLRRYGRGYHTARHRGHGPAVAHRGPHSHHRFAMHHPPGYGHHHFRGPAMRHEHGDREFGSWVPHFRHRDELLAMRDFHAQRSWSHGPRHDVNRRGPTHFAAHPEGHGRHHFAAWHGSQHGEPDGKPGDARHDGRGPSRLDRDRHELPGFPPAFRQDRDLRRSHGDDPARRSTKGDTPNPHATDGERLAQLERSLDQLAEQIRELRAALHR